MEYTNRYTLARGIMDLRQKIIATAFNLFYEQGFHACGVELLASQAGTTKRTLYAHFGSKDGLIAAVLDYRHEQFFALVEQALQGVSGAYSETAYLDFIRAWTHSPEFHGCLFINACAEFSDPNSPFYQQASQHKRQVRELLYQHFVADNSIDAQQAKIAADRAFIFGEGLIVAVQAGQGELVGYFGQA